MTVVRHHFYLLETMKAYDKTNIQTLSLLYAKSRLETILKKQENHTQQEQCSNMLNQLEDALTPPHNIRKRRH